MITKTETIAYRRMTITLAQYEDGFWGWAIGNQVMTPFFFYRATALKSAQLRVDEMKSESQALSHAKDQIDRNLTPVSQPAQIVWCKGEDWWSGEQIENGCMPSDATPYGLVGDEWQPLT